MRGRFLMAAVAAAGAALLAASPANAKQEYPPEEPVLTATATTITAGDTVTLNGTGFEPLEDVVITVDTTALAAPQMGMDEATQETVAIVPVARAAAVRPPRWVVTADADGNFTTTIRLKWPGLATLTATGQESGMTASTTVTVLPGQGKPQLPETGTDLWRLVWIGGAGTIAGGVLLLTGLAWRARRENVDA